MKKSSISGEKYYRIREEDKSMSNQITFITSNIHKLEQVKQFASMDLIHKHLELSEIQSLDLHEIVTYKVKEAYKALQKPVLVEDVSLTIHALGSLPGPFIKWFLKELKPEGLCNLVSNYPDTSATGEVCYGFYDGVEVKMFSGVIKGTITSEPKGENGFGWDRIFIPEGFSITRGQMETADFEATSPRRLALKKFEEYFKTIKS